MLVHLFKFANALPNQDTVFNYYNDQNIVGSGRWLLSVACGLSSYFDLPWVNGILSLLFIALTAVIVTEMLEIRNPVLITLSSGLLVTFPGITETFFYEYTADGYMLAMLLAALAALLSRVDCMSWKTCICAGVCICAACAIYQAYVSFALVLTLCYFILGLLDGKFSKEKLKKWLPAQVCIYVCGLLVYYALWKLLLHVEGYSVNNYQGISSLSLNLKTIIRGIPNSIYILLLLLLERNPLEHGWTLYAVLNVVFLICGAVSIVAAVVKTKLYRKRASLFMLLLSCAMIPFAACMWIFASENVWYRPMMLQSICLVYIFVGILYQKYFSNRAKDAFAVLLAVVIFNNGIMANISYYYMNRTYFATYANAAEMVAKIHQLDTDTKEVAVIGKIQGDLSCIDEQGESIHMLNQLLGPNLMLDERHLLEFLNETFYESYYSVDADWFQDELHTQEIDQMSCWPKKGGIQVIDNVIVIKLRDADRTFPD